MLCARVRCGAAPRACLRGSVGTRGMGLGAVNASAPRSGTESVPTRERGDEEQGGSCCVRERAAERHEERAHAGAWVRGSDEGRWARDRAAQITTRPSIASDNG